VRKSTRAAVLGLAGIWLWAVGVTGQNAPTSSPPELPAGVREQTAAQEQVVARALGRPDQVSDWDTAIEAAERAWQARRAHQGEMWWHTIDARSRLNDLRRLRELSEPERIAVTRELGRLSEVVPRALRAIGESLVDAAAFEAIVAEINAISAAVGQHLGNGHPYQAMTRRLVAALRSSRGQFDEAERNATEARGILIRSLGELHPESAAASYELGSLYLRAGRYAEAQAAFEEARRVRRMTLGVVHQAYADTIAALGVLAVATHRLDAAEALLTTAAQRYGALGAHAGQAGVRARLADLFSATGRDDDARRSHADAVRLDPRSPALRFSQAAFHIAIGEVDEAERMIEEGLAIIPPERRGGLAHALALDVGAMLDRAKGIFPAAEAKYSEALALRRALLGPGHADTLTTVAKRASVRTLMGRYEQAEADYGLVLEGLSAAVGTEHPSYAVALNELALLHQSRRPAEYEQAMSRYREALDTLGGAGEERHPAYVAALHNLASVHHRMGHGASGEEQTTHYRTAERLYLEARAAIETSMSGRQSLRATILDNSARLYLAMGRLADAEPLADEAARMRRGMYGEQHPAFATSLATRAAVLSLNGRPADAATVLLQSTRADWVHVTMNLPALTAEQKRLFLQQSEFAQAERLWTLVFEQHQPATMGLQAALLRKHLLFEATRQESSALRTALASASSDWRRDWDERMDLRRRYAQALLQGAQAGTIRALAERLDALEHRLRRDHADYATQARLQEPDVADVAAALRPGEALVEFVSYRPFDFGTDMPGARRYGALIVRGDRAQPVAVNLGVASSIDQAVRDFTGEMRAKWIPYYKDAWLSDDAAAVRRSENTLARRSQVIRQALWEPLLAHMSGIRRVYIAPDGYIGLLPFEAIAERRDGGWAYLGEDIEFVYVTTGRDLARLSLTASGIPAANTAVLIGNPAFDLASGPDEGEPPPCDPLLRHWGQYEQLERFTVDAREQLQHRGWTVTTLMDEDAREATVLAIAGPRLLQFATHGVFGASRHCPGHPLEAAGGLALSMLKLAGANRLHRPGSDLGDGILTALEVSGMNLAGTELVNLTACETGIVEVTPEGLAGLRQAFLWAGARALTTSLWEVPVEETTSQLAEFYARWLDEENGRGSAGRYAAFRASQLAALAQARKAHGSGHPFFWAGTVFVGDPGDLPSRQGVPSSGGRQSGIQALPAAR
jgi:CHAT domain-containing protein/tetratricopeptide (TPR) repeat protein